jgi:transposase
MTLYCGIDLHANNSVVSVLDEQDQVRFEKRLPNNLELIKASLEPYREEQLACVVESTYNWYWLVDGLMADGFDVRLAHTGAIVQYSGIKHSNDESDARHLSHLLRLGILPEGHIMPKEQRGVRDLLRRRMLLVHQRTLHHLSLQSLIVRYTGQRLSANQIKGLEQDSLKGMLPETICVGAQVTLLAMRWLDQAIDLLEHEVQKLLQSRQDFQLLTSIPGVGKILGATIALETGRLASASLF